MAQVSKRKFSGSTDGRGIKVVATASAGTTIHQAYATGVVAGTWDEIWIYAYNSDTVARLLTIQFGGTTTPDDDIKVTLQPQAGLVPIIPGLILQNASIVRAYAAAANVIVLTGHVNAIGA